MAMLLVTTPCAVVLYVCIGVGGSVCTISSSARSAGVSSLKLMKSAPSSASAADDMTTLMILAIVNTDPLLGGNSVLFDIKKCSPDLLMDFVSDKYEALLWLARTMSLAWYASMASGWVAAQSNNYFTFFIVCSIGFACCAAMDPSAVSIVGFTDHA